MKPIIAAVLCTAAAIGQIGAASAQYCSPGGYYYYPNPPGGYYYWGSPSRPLQRSDAAKSGLELHT